MGDRYQRDAAVFKAFCNEYRLQILERLSTGEKCACDLQEHLDISQSTLSHHMKVLCASGIVVARQEGKWTHYSISGAGAARARGLLDAFMGASLDGACLEEGSGPDAPDGPCDCSG
ncbi:MAG: metalloregulator ArsR/SmtB family transcription factor [Atopobiaceae bacterium]|jgi:ArsR family transcriptional regulator|nr:metalloregulator ArsR/SmtB family transcription factor [Atopobiaceae bacterium]MCH4181457.1 metalloregulator ArsR/SmtB family transcription factor [Atopobiaceae bacterium]MCH4214984.1 metalloregulator ArsR/SmtB family transcription factor [Atopobiaceae bacterium]MCH4230007.1 metalloregulator ArsR/SmtB family transcription factor [Atopobiaceae bacterium]MCH4277159.1 metalloregulator ArsR/SmtB family transcription factor [Atopobiaceae bacterium]